MPNIKPTGLEKVKQLFDDVHKNKSKGFRFKIVNAACQIDEASILPEDHKTPFQALVLSDEVKKSASCYIVANIVYAGQSARVFDEVILFSWINDDATSREAVKEKMLHAASEQELKKKLDYRKKIIIMQSIDELSVDKLFEGIIGTGEKPTEFEGKHIIYDEDRRVYSFAGEISSWTLEAPICFDPLDFGLYSELFQGGAGGTISHLSLIFLPIFFLVLKFL